MTLRTRLLLLLVALLAGALLGSGGLLTLGVQRYAQAQAERTTLNTLSAVAQAGAGLDTADERLGVWYAQLSSAAETSGTAGLMVLPSGQAYRTDNAAPTVPQAAVTRARQTGQARDGGARLLATSDGTVLLLPVPQAEVDALTRRVALTFGAVSGLTLLLAALAAWHLLRVGLRPVRLMARQAETLGGADLSARLPVPGPPDEVRSLAESLNRMLSRLEDTITRLQVEEARTRAFAADASHELRTPLAAIQGSLEVLERAGHDPEARDRLSATLRREARRAARLVDDLLTLTRLDAGEALRLEPLALHTLLPELLATAQDLAPHLTLVLEAEPALVLADRQRLEGAAWNLLRNAIAATPEGGQVTLRLRTRGQVATLSVLNPARLPAEFLTRMFERFARGPGAPPGGAGLGLAIVQATARAHHGDAFATQHDQVLEVGFSLPLSPDTDSV